MWECEWWCRLYKSGESVKSHLRENFPYKRSLSGEGLLQGIIDGRLFGYVQCDIEVPEHLRDYFSNFLPKFRNTIVSRDDIDNLMKQYAEKEKIMVQPRRMLISCFILTNGTIIHPLFLFYLKLGLVCRDSPVCSKHSQKTFWQIRIVCRGCTTTRRWKPKFECCCRDYEITSKKFLWPSDHGSQSTHSDNVSDRWKNTQCN